MRGIHRLKGVIKQYDWGGNTFLPALLHEENAAKKPFAEYWMGVHPLGHALVETGTGEWKQLGELTGPLPYLLKILDVKKMLSVQVHPSKEAAALEFERENAMGIPLDSPLRNYKDPNHKPEMIVALGDFWLLHGFKSPEELVYTLLNVVELRELLPVFNDSGYSGLYKHVMEMPQEDVNRILQPLVDNIAEIYKDAPPEKEDEDFWTARAAESFCHVEHIDRGIFSIYLFNLVHLKKGEGLFQDAGLPHAYLEGACVEIMANSDNVLRGGLTTKHIDVAELLKHTRCEATYPNILIGEAISTLEKNYPAPVADFSLNGFELKKGDTAWFTPPGPEIVVLTQGDVELESTDGALVLKPGQPSAVLLPGTTISLKAVTESLVFRAAVPAHNG
jgi:mannose-6-phosphate isomerase